MQVPPSFHFLITAFLCTAFSGPDWLMRQLLTAAEFKHQPPLQTPSSRRGELPRWKSGKSVIFGLAAPSLLRSMPFQSRTSRRCAAESPVHRAFRGPLFRLRSALGSLGPRLLHPLCRGRWAIPWFGSELLSFVLGIWAPGWASRQLEGHLLEEREFCLCDCSAPCFLEPCSL